MDEVRIRETISFLLVQVAKLHRNAFSSTFSNLGLHVGQDMILSLLWEEDGLTQSQLIKQLQVEPPTVTKMISRMEKADLLERKRDSKDGRVFRVYLTDRGRSLKEPVIKAWNEIEKRLLGELNHEDYLLLKRILLQMQKNLS